MTLEEMIRFVSDQAAMQLLYANVADGMCDRRNGEADEVAVECREEAGALMCVENELRALAARQARAQD
jgi:hypothetical protein